ncbi:hypothetical protein QA600_18630 [Natronococcus sp. A-GB1]|uniref:hypothetical protein n=1 Tax=Natronococcus sp. A-GB1 TaxID=3037648 RepID=UPI00241D6939|nr:hypothetical protein [Natronococcus sp. A-GB1]MDG5761350.1 hypothetical protein [Natronococcus sp. A-GB1]
MARDTAPGRKLPLLAAGILLVLGSAVGWTMLQTDSTDPSHPDTASTQTPPTEDVKTITNTTVDIEDLDPATVNASHIEFRPSGDACFGNC